jgi:lipopolysaccharide transport system ATP-binding protein
MGEILLETIGLSKRFCRRPELAMRYAIMDMLREIRGLPPEEKLRPGEFWALRNVDLHLERGEVLGVVGHNGAGKSTLINLIAGLMRPTSGSIRLYTNRVALMDGSGGLNMLETGRENIAAQLALHGCRAEHITEETYAAIAFAELGEFINAAVGTYSVGMRLRLAFSIYTRLRPDLFIVDEALSGGDLRFRQRFQNYLRSYLDMGGSILFCSHELFQVQTLCKRSMLLDSGCMKMYGDTLDVLKEYQEIMTSSPEPSIFEPTAMTEQQIADEDELEAMGARQRGGAAGALGSQSRAGEAGMPMVESLTIRPLSGNAIFPGDPVMLEVVLNSEQAFEQVIWGLEIGRGEVESITSMVGGYGEHHYAIKAGRNVFRARIERFPLAPSTYELRTGVFELTTGAILVWHGFENAPVRFEIANPGDRATNMMVYRRNIVCLPVDWETIE